MLHEKWIYLDHAATTPLSPSVLDAMMPYLTTEFGNPSAIYGPAGRAKQAVNEARRAIAGELGAAPSEIYFTGGGTEADNWALTGAAQALAQKGRHIITTAIEHHAVLHTCRYLEERGWEITLLPVDQRGLVSPGDLERAIRPDTVLVSVMTANNEIGTIQPIQALARIARLHKVLFHTDAVQAFGHLPLDVDRLGVDLLSASAHKLNGPKGVGLLYIRSGTPMPALLHGGAQERGRRAGTENVAGIVGFGQAVREWAGARQEREEYVRGLRDHLAARLMAELPDLVLNGMPAGQDPQSTRLAGNLNFSIEGVEGESLLILLDMAKICASTGSACTSGSRDPSHVLKAIGRSDRQARGSLRLSLGPENTLEEIDRAADQIAAAVRRLRSLSYCLPPISDRGSPSRL